MKFLHLILHLDSYLAILIAEYHKYFYLIIFLVIFCETGLVITPFLPGDSLLFIAGSLASQPNKLSTTTLAFAVTLGAIMGDNTNFFIGKFLGNLLFSNPNSKIFRKSFLDRTHNFFEKHGGKTIIMGRFLPIIRTYAPFVAGLGHMKYRHFVIFSLGGNVLWIATFFGGGFLFGNAPWVRSHVSILIMIVMVISLIPILKIIFDEFRRKKAD